MRENREINLVLWDLPAQEGFRALLVSCLKSCKGGVFGFDGTESSLEELKNWFSFLSQKKIQLPSVLFVNQSDRGRSRSLTDQKLDEFCKQAGILQWFGPLRWRYAKLTCC